MTRYDQSRRDAADAVEAWFAANSTPTSTIPDQIIEDVLHDVRSTGVCHQVDEWRRAAAAAPGGAKQHFDLTAVLVALAVLARDNRALTFVQAAELLNRRISPEARAMLGYPAPPGRLTTRDLKSRAKAIGNRFNGMLAVIDPIPFRKDRRLTPAEFDACVRALSDEERIERRSRLQWVTDMVIEASIARLPRHVRRQWHGSVAVDATPIPAFSHPYRLEKDSVDGKRREIGLHSFDPTCYWYTRTADKRDELLFDGLKLELKKKFWAHDVTLVVMGADDPADDHLFPSLVLGMSLDRPSAGPAENAMAVLAGIADRGHPAGWLAGDRAYSNAKPEKFQLPARALGYRVIFDYKKTQLGVQTEHEGALQVEGAWYCPSMPDALINAERDSRANHIDQVTRDARIAARAAYLFRPKSAPDADGHVRYMCPASGAAPTVRCPQKPRSIRPATAGRTRIQVTADVQTDPPKACVQDSVTFPAEVGAKLAQELQFGTDGWHAHYATLRNTIEGTNGVLKDPAYQSLASGGRRRLRGIAGQSVLVAFLIYAANLRKLATFMNHARIDQTGRVVRPRKRTTTPLADHRPEPTLHVLTT